MSNPKPLSQKPLAQANVAFIQELQEKFGCEQATVEGAVEQAIKGNRVAGKALPWNLNEKEAIEAQLEQMVSGRAQTAQATQSGPETGIAPSAEGGIVQADHPLTALYVNLRNSAKLIEKGADQLCEQYAEQVADRLLKYPEVANVKVSEKLLSRATPLSGAEIIDCDFFTDGEEFPLLSGK